MSNIQKSRNRLHNIVIVGGGAGGLELATRLGRTLGRRKQALITLVDRSRTHLWKPLLHQVAAGSMDLNDHELDYLYQARWHHFLFRLGSMAGLDRAARKIHLAPTMDEAGREVIPARTVPYDTLVLSVGARYAFAHGTTCAERPVKPYRAPVRIAGDSSSPRPQDKRGRHCISSFSVCCRTYLQRLLGYSALSSE